jgi:hypothetical protein
MDYNDFRDAFKDVLPIIFRAAPLLSALIGSPATGVIIGLLGAIFGQDPCDHCALAEKLKNDPDLFAKLQALEATHGDWLKQLN